MQSNPSKLSPVAVSSMLSTLHVRIDHRQRVPDTHLYLAVPSSVTAASSERAQFFRDAMPLTYVQVTPDLREAMNAIAVGRLDLRQATDKVLPFNQVFFLEIKESRVLLLKYRQLLGSRHLASLSEAQYESVLDRMSVGLTELMARPRST